MQLLNEIKADIKEMLDSSSIVAPAYITLRKQLAFLLKDHENSNEAMYHLTEAHGVSLRTSVMMESTSSETKNDCLSFYSELAQKEADGLMERLREMPSEWTIVQITRDFDPYEAATHRPANTSPKLRGFSIARLPCGSQLNSLTPVSVETSWPEDALLDIIQAFLNVKKELMVKDGSTSQIKLIRRKANDTVEMLTREVGSMCIKQYMVLMLGRLVNKKWEEDIRNRMNRCIDHHGLDDRRRSLLYLLAEGCTHLSDDEIEDFLEEILLDNSYDSLRQKITLELAAIKQDYPSLPIAKRNSVLLILDEHLDVIPWESLVVLGRHPYTRVPSIHFAHYLFRCHKESIKKGLREIPLKEICCLVNPDKNLPSEKITRFMEKRFPTWKNIVGRVPTDEEMIEMLSTGSVFIYSGHGSGCQFLKSDALTKLELKNVQFLFGCSSAALKDYGGDNTMGGSILDFALAGSGCTLGMLWAVTTSDADRLTFSLANNWLPGQALDYDTLNVIESQVKKEPELLRAIIEIRGSTSSVSSYAGFIARGIPIKLIY